jgi:hypothetical protein
VSYAVDEDPIPGLRSAKSTERVVYVVSSEEIGDCYSGCSAKAIYFAGYEFGRRVL